MMSVTPDSKKKVEIVVPPSSSGVKNTPKRRAKILKLKSSSTFIQAPSLEVLEKQEHDQPADIKNSPPVPALARKLT